MSRPPPKPPRDPEGRFDFTWNTWVMDQGYTMVYHFLLDNYHRVGLSNVQMMFIIQMQAFHYNTPDSVSCPSLKTIARKMGITRRYAGIILAQLVTQRMATIYERQGTTSVYSFKPLADACAAEDKKMQRLGRNIKLKHIREHKTPKQPHTGPRRTTIPDPLTPAGQHENNRRAKLRDNMRRFNEGKPERQTDAERRANPAPTPEPGTRIRAVKKRPP